jgi:hypothetical protein
LTDTIYVKGKHIKFYSSELSQAVPARPYGEGTSKVKEARESSSKLVFKGLVPAKTNQTNLSTSLFSIPVR